MTTAHFRVGDYDPGAFDRQPLRAYNVAPNALLMNFKVVRYWFEPDLDSDSVTVKLDPTLDNLRVRNRLGLAAGACRGYQRGITISTNEAVDEVTFSGKFPNGCKRYALDRTALSHNEYVYGLFKTLWRELGGRFDGEWRNVDVGDTIPADAQPFLSFDSLPLSEMIARVNKHSNNVMARQLVYTLSAEVNGPPGTETGGRDVIANWLAENDLESCKCAIENGAGLSRDSRIAAVDMVSLSAVRVAAALHARVSCLDVDFRARRHAAAAFQGLAADWQGAPQDRIDGSCDGHRGLSAVEIGTAPGGCRDAEPHRRASWPGRRGAGGTAALAL